MITKLNKHCYANLAIPLTNTFNLKPYYVYSRIRDAKLNEFMFFTISRCMTSTLAEEMNEIPYRG